MRYTEIELIRKHEQNMYLLDMQINDNKLVFADIENILEGMVHVNHHDFAIAYINQSSEDLVGFHPQRLISEGTSMFLKFFDMSLWNVFMPRLISFFQKGDNNAVCTGFQAIKPPHQKDYQLLLTTSKIYKKEDNYLSMSIPVDILDASVNKLEKIIEQDLFLRKNFDRFASLTKKEKEILKLVAEGYLHKEIAEMTFNSVHTIHTHKKNIYRKLDINNISEVFKYATSFDLI